MKLQGDAGSLSRVAFLQHYTTPVTGHSELGQESRGNLLGLYARAFALKIARTTATGTNKLPSSGARPRIPRTSAPPGESPIICPTRSSPTQGVEGVVKELVAGVAGANAEQYNEYDATTSSRPSFQLLACWEAIGALSALIRTIRYGVIISWSGESLPRRNQLQYPQSDKHARFSEQEVTRWLAQGFFRGDILGVRPQNRDNGLFFCGRVHEATPRYRLHPSK